MPLALPTSTTTTALNTSRALAYFSSRPRFRAPLSSGVETGAAVGASVAPSFDRAAGAADYYVRPEVDDGGIPRPLLIAGGAAAVALAGFVVFRLKRKRGR